MNNLEETLARTVGRMPAWAVLAVSVGVYVLFGIGVAFGAATTTTSRIVWNAFGVAWSWALMLAWLVTNQQRQHRRLLLEWTSNLRRLSATEFEWLVGEVLRREGWKVDEVGQPDRPDGNVDLEATRAGRKVVVQCKRWQSMVVGVDEVRKLAGTVSAEGLEPGSGVLVTLSEFSRDAITEAARTGIELVDHRALLRRIEQVRGSEPCPLCGQPMILDRSPHGWWLRCRRCNGKRDLGRDPGGAVDLLLDQGAG
jgi:HJR/Mrr/RecB family endonuclease